MKAFIRNLLCLSFAAVLVALPFTVSAAKYPSPTPDFFVNDFADVIHSSHESRMQQMGETLYENTSAQVVVCTVESLNGEDIRSYGYNLAEQWEIGDERNDSGVLLLFALNDRQVSIEVGYGLEGDLTDGRTGRILDEFAIPDFYDDNFSQGLYNTYEELIRLVSQIDSEGGIEEESDGSDLVTIIVGIIVFIIIISLFFFKGGGRGKRHIDIMDILIAKHIFDGGSHHGGFGGGGFRGGGGGFGGGGSSRGF